MGTFEVTIEIGGQDGRQWLPHTCLVDTGASYTWIPSTLLRQLDVEPQARWEFEIANGEIVQRDVAQTWVRYEGSSHVTFVVFGDEDSSAMLGAYTLEGFRLGVDPVNRRLVPVRGLALTVMASKP